MRRHDTDFVSLVSGLLFLIVAVVHITARTSDTELNLRWMAPVVLVLFGVLGLLGAVRSPRRSTGGVPAVDEAPLRAGADEASLPAEADDARLPAEADDARLPAEADDASTER